MLTYFKFREDSVPGIGNSVMSSSISSLKDLEGSILAFSRKLGIHAFISSLPLAVMERNILPSLHILAIGVKKGNRLFIGGEEVEL